MNLLLYRVVVIFRNLHPEFSRDLRYLTLLSSYPNRLLESVISDKKLQFVVELNRILDIKTKLSTSFHSQIDDQTD